MSDNKSIDLEKGNFKYNISKQDNSRYIKTKEVQKVCSICKQEYKDIQIFINNVCAEKFAICDNCRKNLLTKYNLVEMAKNGIKQ